jgi:hypothetical protein
VSGSDLRLSIREIDLRNCYPFSIRSEGGALFCWFCGDS